MKPYYQDEHVTLLTGDAATVAATLDPRSIQTVVTSPPYFGLRDYGVEGQLGAEPSPSEFIANLVAVFEAIRPALADDGTLWVNLGDSYNNTASGQNGTAKTGITGGRHDRMGARRVNLPDGIPAKNLLGIPWRFAFAMQDAGWILRNDIIWAKPNGMPSSVQDRVASKHEHIFLFSKGPRYYFDLDSIKVPLKTSTEQVARAGASARANHAFGSINGSAVGDKSFANPLTSANPGDVWTVPTQPYPGAHFAVFPPAIPERCILAGSRPGDTVLDPFSGSGTTGMVAGKHGRRYVGIDLNPDYHHLALKTRLAQDVLDLGK